MQLPVENILPQAMCLTCHAPVSATENFCPQCGAKLKEPSISISVGRQAFIYLFSFFLAPLGLIYAIKYLKQPNPMARRIGITVIVITILAVLLMIWMTSAFARWESNLLNLNGL